MSGQQVAVVGAGGHAKVVIATLQALGHEVLVALDDDPARRGDAVLGVPVAGPTAAWLGERPGTSAVLAVGDNRARRRLAGELPGEWLAVVHPRAVVHPSARVAPGAVVFAGAVVQPEARVGAHGIVNTGATVDHDADVGAFAHVAPGAHLCGGVTLGEGVLLGVGAVATPGRTVGAWTTVGAGAAVTADLPAGVTAVGVPARVRP